MTSENRYAYHRREWDGGWFDNNSEEVNSCSSCFILKSASFSKWLVGMGLEVFSIHIPDAFLCYNICNTNLDKMSRNTKKPAKCY